MVFSELSGPVVLCLSPISEIFHQLSLQLFLLLFVFLLSPVFPLHVHHAFCNHLTVCGYSVSFCSFYFLFIQFRKSIDIFTHWFLCHIQLEPISPSESIFIQLHFSPQHFLFYSLYYFSFSTYIIHLFLHVV